MVDGNPAMLEMLLQPQDYDAEFDDQMDAQMQNGVNNYNRTNSRFQQSPNRLSISTDFMVAFCK